MGLFDSDGSITKIKRPNKATYRHYNGEYVFGVNFTGTLETINYIKDFFDSSVRSIKRYNNGTNNHNVSF